MKMEERGYSNMNMTGELVDSPTPTWIEEAL